MLYIFQHLSRVATGSVWITGAKSDAAQPTCRNALMKASLSVVRKGGGCGGGQASSDAIVNLTDY